MSFTQNAFSDYALAVQNKKAAVIGHFFNLEKFLTNAASVSVLERKPWPGDFPDSACEYILPEQDFVFITGSAFINKTLPRLLQLSGKSRAIVLGPSTPMSPVLFKFGADELSGLSPDYLPVSKADEVGAGNVKMSACANHTLYKRHHGEFLSIYKDLRMSALEDAIRISLSLIYPST